LSPVGREAAVRAVREPAVLAAPGQGVAGAGGLKWVGATHS
jgi:hypothetical protein